MQFERADLGIIVVERGQVGIVLPDFPAGCSHVDQESAGIRELKVAHGGRHHDDVARAERAFEDQPLCRGFPGRG
jgi:hypothetical protein